uniref:Mannose-1-phosphate guanylyltransferase n=1 Tax=candidate division CPR3 bacterium TaxID=2268181 RepID=A0A7C4M201_UNCC3
MDKPSDPIVFILAGGSGTRLAPLSLNMEGKLPKQFLSILSDKTMFQETIDIFPENIKKATISLDKFSDVIKEQGEGKIDILAEPFGCNTAMAIGLGAVYAIKKTGDENVVVFFKPSDHYIDKRYFTDYFNIVCNQAKKGKIILMGIKPSRPETGLGYIKIKNLEEEKDGAKIYNIECFVEKPNLEKATEYVESGKFYWNSGMFAFTAKLILDKLKENAPEIHEALMKIKEDLGSEKEKETIKKYYQSIKDQDKNISIDYAVMEKEADNILMVEVDEKLKWDDIGLWIALERYFEVDSNKNIVKGKNIKIDNCKKCLILDYNKKYRLEAKNIDEHLFVITENGVLVCPKSSSIRAKDIVEDLKKGKKEILVDCKNISIKNETELPIACIDCNGLDMILEDNLIRIKRE